MTRPGTPLPSPQAILDREAAQKRTAIIGSVVAAVLIAIAVILEQIVQSAGVPRFAHTDLAQTLAAQAAGTPQPKSFLTAVGQFKIEHETLTTLTAILRALSFVAIIPMTLFLLSGARERGGTLRRFMEPVAAAGLAIVAVGTAVVGFLEPAFYHAARDAGFTPGAIRDAYKNSDIVTASAPVFLGSIMAALPVAMGAIQAMRMGLLSKILGYMGVLIGLLFVLQYDTTGLLRAAWFAAVAWLVAGRLPGGLPTAWATGVAVPMEPRQPRKPPVLKDRPVKGRKGGSSDPADDATGDDDASKPKNQAAANSGKNQKGPRLTK